MKRRFRYIGPKRVIVVYLFLVIAIDLKAQQVASGSLNMNRSLIPKGQGSLE